MRTYTFPFAKKHIYTHTFDVADSPCFRQSQKFSAPRVSSAQKGIGMKPTKATTAEFTIDSNFTL